MKINYERLNKLQAALVSSIESRRPGENFQRLMGLDSIDRRLYGIYLVETFHYTRHNTRNQALVACREEKMDINYAKFCLKHAMEEAGHEYMALADLNSMGMKIPEEMLSKPLPETESLIGYIYRVSQLGNPLARLGYSYWAESVYSFSSNGTKLFQDSLNLKDSQMTFLVAHAKIDAEHFEDIKEALSRFAKTDEDWSAVEECMVHTLLLTRRMLDQIIGEYLKIIDGHSTRYDYLDGLKDTN